MWTIIAGSRAITNYALIEQAVRLSGFRITKVVSGCARGVDALGERYAERHGLPIAYFRADWQRHGNAAGPRRNEAMARYVGKGGALVAVWDGVSRGTKNMIEVAEREGLAVFVMRLDEVVDEEVA